MKNDSDDDHQVDMAIPILHCPAIVSCFGDTTVHAPIVNSNADQELTTTDQPRLSFDLPCIFCNKCLPDIRKRRQEYFLKESLIQPHAGSFIFAGV